jgi:hypothetical protein
VSPAGRNVDVAAKALKHGEFLAGYVGLDRARNRSYSRLLLPFKPKLDAFVHLREVPHVLRLKRIRKDDELPAVSV